MPLEPYDWASKWLMYHTLAKDARISPTIWLLGLGCYGALYKINKILMVISLPTSLFTHKERLQDETTFETLTDPPPILFVD